MAIVVVVVVVTSLPSHVLQIVVLQHPLVRGWLVVTHEVLLHVDVEALSLARQPDSLPQ